MTRQNDLFYAFETASAAVPQAGRGFAPSKGERFLLYCLALLAGAVFSLCFLPLPARAAETPACPGFFYGHQPPQSNMSVHILCSRHFALGYSEDRTSALWSAEHLTRTGLEHAGSLPPSRARFYPDERVPVTSRAQLEDYRQVPLIPAPLVPHEDMPDNASRIESYALTNAVPEDPRFHALSWKGIEQEIRKEVMENEEAYVITGVGYLVSLGTLGWDQIHVPTHIWKAVYLPRQKKGRAIACRNQMPSKCHWITNLEELRTMTGIDPFPLFTQDQQGQDSAPAAALETESESSSTALPAGSQADISAGSTALATAEAPQAQEAAPPRDLEFSPR